MIAIVEDDPAMRRTMRRIIEQMEEPVNVFGSAEAFLRHGVPQTFDCLVVDIHLPGMSGLELIAHLARSGIRVPFVCVTALEDEAYRREAEAAGCVTYLCKPFEAVVLAAALRAALNPRPNDRAANGECGCKGEGDGGAERTGIESEPALEVITETCYEEGKR
jgi:FixJ family two-component response regulator